MSPCNKLSTNPLLAHFVIFFLLFSIKHDSRFDLVENWTTGLRGSLKQLLLPSDCPWSVILVGVRTPLRSSLLIWLRRSVMAFCLFVFCQPWCYAPSCWESPPQSPSSQVSGDQHHWSSYSVTPRHRLVSAVMVQMCSSSVRGWEETLTRDLKRVKCDTLTEIYDLIMSRLKGRARDMVKVSLHSCTELNPSNLSLAVFDLLKHLDSHMSDNCSSTCSLLLRGLF